MEYYIKTFPNESLAKSDAAHIKREIQKRGYRFVSEDIETKVIAEGKKNYILKISYE